MPSNEGNVRSLNQTGAVNEAIGYIAEAIDQGAEKIVVVHVNEDGTMEGYGFGPVTFPDLTYFAAYLQKRAIDAIDS